MTETSNPVVEALDHFVLRVHNLEASLAFYRDLLGLGVQFLEEYRAGSLPFVSVRVGSQLIDLLPDGTYKPDEHPESSGLLHFCLRLRRPALDEAVDWLRERGVEILEDAPMPRMGASGMGRAIYVRDPDGYVVELKEAPAAA